VVQRPSGALKGGEGISNSPSTTERRNHVGMGSCEALALAEEGGGFARKGKENLTESKEPRIRLPKRQVSLGRRKKGWPRKWGGEGKG